MSDNSKCFFIKSNTLQNLANAAHSYDWANDGRIPAFSAEYIWGNVCRLNEVELLVFAGLLARHGRHDLSVAVACYAHETEIQTGCRIDFATWHGLWTRRQLDRPYATTDNKHQL